MTLAGTITRDQAVNRLRAALAAMTDEENCMCKVAADRGLFCHGFRQFTDEQLRERYAWIVRKKPDIARAELEAIANDWQLAQQDVRQLPIACDIQAKVHDTCRGWDDFTDEQLAGMLKEALGETLRIA